MRPQPPRGRGRVGVWMLSLAAFLNHFQDPLVGREPGREMASMASQSHRCPAPSNCRMKYLFRLIGSYTHSLTRYEMSSRGTCSNPLSPNPPFPLKHEISLMQAHPFLSSLSCPQVSSVGLTRADKWECCQIMISVWCLELSRNYGHSSESQGRR